MSERFRNHHRVCLKISVNYRECGKSEWACQRDPSKRHGPYFE